MTTENTQAGDGSAVQPSADAVGSLNWEERLAAAREKRLQVLEERRKSGQVGPDKQVIVGPKPWETIDKDDAAGLVFVDEFDPDDFDYEDSGPPQSSEMIVVPRSVAAAKPEADIETGLEDIPDEKAKMHWRPIAFIGLGVLGCATAFGAGMFVSKTELPPDFLTGSSIFGTEAQDAVAETETANWGRSAQVNDAAEPNTPTPSASQTTIDSLASGISDDVVAVAIETTRTGTERAAFDAPIAIPPDAGALNQVTRPQLTLGNAETPVLITPPPNLSLPPVVARLPAVELPRSLSFGATPATGGIAADGLIERVGLSGLSPLGADDTASTDAPLSFDLNTAHGLDPLVAAPTIKLPAIGSVVVAQATSFDDDSVRALAEPRGLTAPKQSISEITIASQPGPRPGALIDMQTDLTPTTGPRESSAISLLTFAEPVMTRPNLPGLAAMDVARADEILPEIPQLASIPQHVTVTFALAAPVASQADVPVPSLDVVTKAQPTPISTPDIDFTSPPTAILSPEGRPALFGNPERLSVRMHIPSAVPEAGFSERADLLRATGLPLTTARVDINISKDQIRFFHAEDAMVASTIADEIGATVRDFTAFTPQPPEGTVEIWLSGSSARPAQTTMAPKATTPTTTSRPRQTDPAAELRNRLTRKLRRGDHL